MIKAEIIADSRNEFGNRITSFVCTFPRIILAEVNTHRMLSRNSASSRAIPFEKMLQKVQDDPFIPIKWMKDHSGMQGNEYFEDNESIGKLTANWMIARDYATRQAVIFAGLGLTKQIVNRLLEPFMWHTAIITATEFENFFALRANGAAEIHLQDLAHKMLDAMNNSTPKQLKAGEWHIPFGDKIDESKLNFYIGPDDLIMQLKWIQEQKIKIATARCARVSYDNFKGKDDYEADIKLHDRLAASGHFSPFEHCAKVMEDFEYHSLYNGRIERSWNKDDIREKEDLLRNAFISKDNMGWLGNFRGFIQYRKTLQGENKTDNRLKK